MSVIDELRSYFGSTFDNEDDIDILRHWMYYGLSGWFQGAGPKAFDPFSADFIGELPFENQFLNFVNKNFSEHSQDGGHDRANLFKALMSILTIPNFYKDNTKAFLFLVATSTKVDGIRIVGTLKTLLAQPAFLGVKLESGLTLYRSIISAIYETRINNTFVADFFRKALDELHIDPTVFRLVAPRLMSVTNTCDDQIKVLESLESGYIVFQQYLAENDPEFALEDISELQNDIRKILGNSFLLNLHGVSIEKRNLIRDLSIVEGFVPPDQIVESEHPRIADKGTNWRGEAFLDKSDLLDRYELAVGA